MGKQGGGIWERPRTYHVPRLRGDQVVAVNRRGHRGFREPRGDKLQNRHLRRGVLHGDTIGSQFQVGNPADGRGGVFRVVQVAVHDFLRQGQRRVVEFPPHHPQVGVHRGVDGVHGFRAGRVQVGHHDRFVNQCVERLRRAHRVHALPFVAKPVPTEINGVALALLDQFAKDGLFVRLRWVKQSVSLS